MCRYLTILCLLLLGPGLAAQGSDTGEARSAVVRIAGTYQAPNFKEPWKPGNLGRGVGTGFVIDGQRILTNAHVVSNAKLLVIEREGDPQRYPAKVAYIAHDCDLAILSVDDPTFFQGMPALEFGDVPKLDSTVAAVGYPIGGNRISITRGIVSRIEFRSYTHSGIQQHLTIQVDAAINPGNSGGPVVQDGKVVGVAFQAYPGAVAQNTGYIIPVPVVRRFLEDIKDGQYDGYVELGLEVQNLQSRSFRQFLGLPDDNRGVLVTDVVKAASAAGVIEPGDVLLDIDGFPILSDARIELEGSRVRLEEIVERRFHGDNVVFTVMRDGKQQKATVTLKGAWPYSIFANQYDVRARYLIHAGLVFQPVSKNFLAASNLRDLDVLYHYNHFVQEEIYLERPEIVVLSMILEDEANSELDAFQGKIVDRVNGKDVRTLKELHAALQEEAEYHVIEMVNENRPLVVASARARDASARIRRNYQISQEYYLGE